MAELTRDDADAFVFNPWHELLPRLRWTVTFFRHAVAIARPSRRAARGVDQGLIQRVPDEEGVRDVLAVWIEALPLRLEKMKLMSVCDHAPVIDYRRRT
jgi:hypothetical protein